MKADTVRGHLDGMILAVVQDEPLHGYGIAEALRAQSDGALDLPTGTLYPALRRLERLGYLRSSWSTVDGRKRRTYELTRSGQAELSARQEDWQEVSRVIGTILRTRTAT
ncbi:PadR family transcriptional regulator [Actinobacteria bacterium YIM 96077]|uniref:PadR family transcriptional regulator n=1 Tax=Phytoactinopolyspora halophila TaxID=1981511 RepID=A0A329R3X9_9ACTN|nr:helix-turn-helix transcriptional regulator [Phytoactinopolyspora halophila]AYY12007.1 PadR family transcriptional regulator [Actinobacteria bacterium YIM 96077]RAW18759.1 PadR family transcriptional regulator [Phytoactinopolyspora halophila]